MSTFWLDVHAGSFQAVFAAVLAILTLVLVWVTRTYAKTAEQQRFDQFRPVVRPVDESGMKDDPNLDWTMLAAHTRLQNVGRGVALVVSGVLFPPEPIQPTKDVGPRRTLWKWSAILPGPEGAEVHFGDGGTTMLGSVRIEDETLFAPQRPSLCESMFGGKYTVLARMTLTYQDIFGRNHASIFDYYAMFGWQLVKILPNARQCLEDLDREARAG